MGLTFVKLGLHPGMAATHFLPLIAGPQVAADLLLTGLQGILCGATSVSTHFLVHGGRPRHSLLLCSPS